MSTALSMDVPMLWQIRHGLPYDDIAFMESNEPEHLMLRFQLVVADTVSLFDQFVFMVRGVLLV